jgi:hypothetical protein
MDGQSTYIPSPTGTAYAWLAELATEGNTQWNAG